MIMTNHDKSLFYDIVENFEGFSSRPYRCPAGILTIGYGHTKGVKPSDRVTPEEARILLISDFEKVFTLLKNFNFALEEYELFALADFVFNLGFGKFVNSSLFNLLDQYSHVHSSSSSEHYRQLICLKIEEFVYYTDKHGHKKKSIGLVRRRKFESYLFSTGKLDTFSSSHVF